MTAGTGPPLGGSTAPEVESVLFPELAVAINAGYISYSQLIEVDWGRRQSDKSLAEAAAEYERLYPLVLRAFLGSHGNIQDRFLAINIRSDVARTAAAVKDKAKPYHIPPRARQADFHLVYDLAKVPVGSELLTRIEMMAADATHLLKGRKLIDCLDQLYSKTTDVLGIILWAAESKSKSGLETWWLKFRAEEAPAAAAGAPAGAHPPHHSVAASIEERLAIISRDLDVIELKYLITAARLRYFFAAAGSAVLLSALLLLLSWFAVEPRTFGQLFSGFQLVLLLGTAGALLSVVQRISSGTLDVRYDLGWTNTILLGGLRPVIGLGGGALVWLLVQAKVLANPTGSDYYLAAIAFALGIAERRLPDVVTESGILARLTPGGSSNGKSKPKR